MSSPVSSTTSVAEDAVDVILRDGTTLRLRPPTAADADARCSRSSPGFPTRAATCASTACGAWTRSSSSRSSTPTGTSAARSSERSRTTARSASSRSANYVRWRDPALAESAFVVADELQGRGIGTRLLEQLAARAAAAGIERFVAEVAAGNHRMLGVFTAAGFEVARKSEHGETEVRFPITPTEGFRARVEERDHVAVAASLTSFFTPKSVAVIGASRRRGSIGGELFRNVLAADFAGAAYPVNRSGEPVAGVRAYSSVEEIPDEIDLAVICVPGAQVLDAAASCLRHGVRALCVISSGFAETGAEGRERQEQLLALVRAHGARLVGPNCLGIASSAPRLNATFAPRELPPGRIGFSSQSGALGLALLEKAAERNLGFSAFVSIGNKADVSSNDLLEWWEDDPETDLVLLYLESFGNPRKFGRIARRVARRKPILALKAGSTGAGARAASSHTAALAGSETAVDAIFRQAGVLRVRTLEELVDAASLFSSQPLPAGRRVGVMTNAGGLGILCADACEAAGLSLPNLSDETRAALAEVLPREASLGNPVDLLGSATPATYAAALAPLLADPNVDALIVLFVPPVIAGAEEVADALQRTLAELQTEKPVLAVVMSADGTPSVLRTSSSLVAAFPYPESAARALGLAAERAEWLRRPAGSIRALDDIDAPRARRIVDEALTGSSEVWLDPATTSELPRGVRRPGRARAPRRRRGRGSRSRTRARLSRRRQDRGRGRAQERHRRRCARPRRRGSRTRRRHADRRPGARPVADRRRRRAAGGRRPGSGVRAARRVRARRCLRRADRRRGLPDRAADRRGRRGARVQGKAGRLVRGFRGSPPADAAALVDLVERLARLADDLPEVAELDLNPVLALPEGCVAVDARIRLQARPSNHSLKSW